MLLPSSPVTQWSTPSWGHWGIKNEMQSVQPSSHDSGHYHTDESPLSIKGCCLLTKLCTHTPPVRSFSSLPPLSSFMFLSKWLPSLFLLIPSLSPSPCLSPGGGAELTEDCGRHSLSLTHYRGVAVLAMPAAISLSGLC